ncbi:hypothetical protein [Trichormus variabilis]|uniref:Uncharacterized protein n=1 Tax=Trichormus variabilis SAG 1403-4b TaxID=447716 RepID=A0A3S1C874_ANAVA|nr:hypothetical protein [Trichormus variabilis]MBD2625429.1 hypothetical protein [Trichormus variabilis FACHB-164]RUS98714.1 hypothetical protein DSM107003_07330 [Trichormus variabilis SAG 1403-4b]
MNPLSKLFGVTLGSLSIMTAMNDASLAASKTLNVDPNYNNDLCIVVGPIRNSGSFTVVWGSYEGTVSIPGDGGQKSNGLALFARGNNYPQMTIYYDNGLQQEPYLVKESCYNKGLQPHWLNWRSR